MGHAHGPAGGEAHSDRRRLATALAVAGATLLLEVWGSIVTGSLALLADAAHVLSDAAALALAFVAVWLAARPHTLAETFGYHRAEVLAALANAVTLLAISGYIVWEAADRLRDPAEVQGLGLLGIAGVGLAANVLQATILGHSHSINVRAARLHVLSDLGGSVVAILAGLGIALTGWQPLDPLLSLVIVGLIVFGALRLLRETLSILMEHTPPGIEVEELARAILEQPEVMSVHDPHLWTITTGFVAFTAHIVVRPDADAVHVSARAARSLRERFGVEHATIQPEHPRLHELEEVPGGRPADAGAAE
jgi:cobalt-zinc-cadmium efflux system protein